MSMSFILERVRDFLRIEMSLEADQCAVRPGGAPPDAAGPIYLAIDEAGVKSTSREHLTEEFEIEVCIWRRSGEYPDDRTGDVLLRDDGYLTGLVTLDDLERRVVTLIHANYIDLMKAVNESAGLGSEPLGDVFQLSLFYEGRRATEILRTSVDPDAPVWFGRRLRFAGMNRVQAVDVMA